MFSVFLTDSLLQVKYKTELKYWIFSQYCARRFKELKALKGRRVVKIINK